MHAMMNIALRAARSAAEALLQKSDRLDRIKIINSDPLNFISSADRDSEAIILHHLHKAFPNHSILSRISEKIEGDREAATWLIDPLIGSLNYSRGIEQYGVAIACKIDANLTVSVILLPALNEEFTATRGEGSQLNNRRVRVSDLKDNNYPIFALESEIANFSQLSSIMQSLTNSKASWRMTGSSAINMAYTAAGRFTAGWCVNQMSNSQQAAILLLTEAGALIGSENGNPDLNTASELLFASPKIFKSLVKIRQTQCN